MGYVELAEAEKKKAENSEAGFKKKALETGKKLSADIQKEIKEVVASHKTALLKDLADKMKAKAEKTAGEDAVPEAIAKMLKTITDQAELNIKGIETKLLQTTEKAVGTWIQDTARPWPKQQKHRSSERHKLFVHAIWT